MTRSLPQLNSQKSRTEQNSSLTKQSRISCSHTSNTKSIMIEKRMSPHSRKATTVLYCSRKRITKDQKFLLKITVGWDHLLSKRYFLMIITLSEDSIQTKLKFYIAFALKVCSQSTAPGQFPTQAITARRINCYSAG